MRRECYVFATRRRRRGTWVEGFDKTELLQRLKDSLRDQLGTLRESQQAAQAGAIHEEARQEDPKDTRAIESQYIARGFAERVEGLQDNLAALRRLRLDAFGEDDPIASSAVVGLLDQTSRQETCYFIVPVAGGELLRLGDRRIRTLTPSSPLGQALVGRFEGDAVEVELPGRRLVATVEWVR